MHRARLSVRSPGLSASPVSDGFEARGDRGTGYGDGAFLFRLQLVSAAALAVIGLRQWDCESDILPMAR